jgi:hypothetical protein
MSGRGMEINAHVMPKDYRIHPYDVLNGRDKMAFNNVGNRRFRITLALALTKYQTAPNRQAKSEMIISIVELVRNNGGRFLVKSSEGWIEVGDRAAREKVGHALRDMVSASATRTTKKSGRSRSVSPTCVALDEELLDPLDVSFTCVFPDQYIPALCDALSNESSDDQLANTFY